MFRLHRCRVSGQVKRKLKAINYRSKSIGSWTQMSLGSQELPADPLLLDRIGRVTLANLV